MLAPMEGTQRRDLLQSSGALDCNSFEVHVAACVVALAEQEARELGEPLGRCMGLDPSELGEFLQRFFPGLESDLTNSVGPDALLVSEEESRIRHLLTRFSSERSWLEGMLAKIVARRCLAPNHLWQDLGLGSREELSELMRRHFPALVAKNAAGMRWKKFFYRMVCADHDHGLCTSPTCQECEDYSSCFGSESGTSLLPRKLTALADI
jgi:nitrogen fixation protein NifQ